MHHQQNIRLQAFVTFMGLLLWMGKTAAFFITHSNSILTDALESVVNVLAGFFALYSVILASQPTDKNHPYGHGKIEFISATLEGSLIILAGLLMIGKSAYNFFNLYEIEKLETGIGLVAVAGAVNFGLGKWLEIQGKKSNSMTLLADGKHLQSDAYSTVGMLVGLGIVYFTGYVWLDNLMAMLFGGFIVYTGLHILRQSLAGKFLNSNRQAHWIDFHNLRIIKFGSRLHIDCHVTMPYFLNIREANVEVKSIEALINRHFGETVEMFIHIDNCEGDSCKICQKTDCTLRQFAQTKRIEWTQDNVMASQKHHLES
jgi:cation diffusion facilitator family transporter